MKNILVGIDFHEETGTLVEKAYEFSKPFGAKIWLLHAAAPEPDFVGYEVGPGFVRDYRADELKRENKILTEYVNMLKKKGVDVVGMLVQGPTIDVIMDESRKLDIDLIVFGHHKHSFLYTLFFGDTSTDIIKKSEIPVLVIPLNE